MKYSNLLCLPNLTSKIFLYHHYLENLSFKTTSSTMSKLSLAEVLDITIRATNICVSKDETLLLEYVTTMEGLQGIETELSRVKWYGAEDLLGWPHSSKTGKRVLDKRSSRIDRIISAVARRTIIINTNIIAKAIFNCS